MNNLNTTHPRTATQVVVKQNVRTRLGARPLSLDIINHFPMFLRFTGKVR